MIHTDLQKFCWQICLVVLGTTAAISASAGVSSLQATSDAQNSYYQFNYSGTPTYYQIFLDLDKKSTTGYKTGGVGAEFLLENGKLFRYSGTGGNWSWSLLKSISFGKTSTTAKFTVARADIGSPSSLNVVARTHPPVSTSVIVSQMLSAPTVSLSISPLKASSDSSTVSYQYSYTGTPNYLQVFMDTDLNSSTGLSIAGIGADFAIENGNLYRYSGSNGGWGWTLLKSVNLGNINSSASWTLPQSDIGSPSSLKVVGRVTGPNGSTSATSAVVSQVLSSPVPVPAPAPAPVPAPAPGPTSQVTYSPSTAIFPNPERGFFWMNTCESSTWNSTQLQSYRSQGISLVHCMFYLYNFKNSAISLATLDQFQKNMDVVRANGMKMAIRFAYTQNTAGDDASPSQVMAHLDQLAPFLAKNNDIIVVVQAGFIGAWGEWAYSQNFGNAGRLTAQNQADRKMVLDKLLQVLPSNRMVEVRTPGYKMQMYGSTALSSTEAFTGTPRARVGQHNDCFLASANDWGTYSNTSVEYPWLSQETKYLPMGGETCNPNPPRSSCATALSEMSQFHWSYLNNGYHQTVIDGWKNEGCFDTIRMKLGYRFVLQSGSFTSSVSVGGTINVNISLVNQGFAAPFNSRNVELILRNNSTGAIFKAALNADPRRWLPGSPITLNQNVVLPSSMPAGSYSLLLNLPDPAPALSARPEYSIQLANTNVWEPSTGYNKLNVTLNVSQ